MTEQDLGPWTAIKDYPGIAEIYPEVLLYMQRILTGDVGADEFYGFIEADPDREAALDREYEELGNKTPLAALRAYLENMDGIIELLLLAMTINFNQLVGVIFSNN